MEIINSTQFDEVTSKGIVVVDFFANWCGPCKMLAPVLEEMADEYKQVKFVKVDVDQDVDLARRYGIQSIPNVIFFKDGKAVDQLVGFAGKDGVLEKLNPFIIIVSNLFSSMIKNIVLDMGNVCCKWDVDYISSKLTTNKGDQEFLTNIFFKVHNGCN